MSDVWFDIPDVNEEVPEERRREILCRKMRFAVNGLKENINYYEIRLRWIKTRRRSQIYTLAVMVPCFAVCFALYYFYLRADRTSMDDILQFFSEEAIYAVVILIFHAGLIKTGGRYYSLAEEKQDLEDEILKIKIDIDKLERMAERRDEDEDFEQDAQRLLDEIGPELQKKKKYADYLFGERVDINKKYERRLNSNLLVYKSGSGIFSIAGDKDKSKHFD